MTTPARTRAPLSRQRVLATALDYVDTHGIDELTMHKLAAGLGVGDMSLYNHVRNKDDLLAGIAGLVWAEAAAAAPAGDDTVAWLHTLGHAIRDACTRHRNVLPAMTGPGVFPPAMLQVIADQFDRAGPAGPPPELAAAIAIVTAYAIGSALTATTGIGPVQATETERQRIRRVTRALPADTPDRLIDTALTVCGSDTGTLFAAGLDAVITGSGPRGTTRRQSTDADTQAH